MDYNIERFVEAQNTHYAQALNEIRQGEKRSHWIWFIFPQHKDLGFSSLSQKYGIRDIEEAKQYLENPLLNQHLYEISQELLKHKGKNIEDIMGQIDAMKLKSCMTLFDIIAPNDVFGKVLQTFYNSEKDTNTIRLVFP